MQNTCEGKECCLPSMTLLIILVLSVMLFSYHWAWVRTPLQRVRVRQEVMRRRNNPNWESVSLSEWLWCTLCRRRPFHGNFFTQLVMLMDRSLCQTAMSLCVPSAPHSPVGGQLLARQDLLCYFTVTYAQLPLSPAESEWANDYVFDSLWQYVLRRQLSNW